MNKKYIKLSSLVMAATLGLSLFAGCSVKSDTEVSPEASAPEVSVSPSAPAESPTPTKSVTKDDISSSLKAYGDKVFDISWSPDDSAVAFIKDEDKTGNVYVWKTGEDNAKLVMESDPTTDGFSWSPNSKYFLINVGHMGPGTITSTLIDAESLEVASAELSTVSISPPVWSADSRFLALSSWADYSTVEITAFAVASKTTASLIKSNNTYGPYVVESWGADNVIKYTEMTNTSDRVEKTIEIGE